MDRLRLVAAAPVGALAARGWRPYAGPVLFLLAVTVAVGLLRGHLGGHSSAVTVRKHPATARTSRARPKPKAVHHAAHKLYVVRAGDTIEAIASRTGTTTESILKLNPTVAPTALFIGEKLRLR